MAKNYWKEKWRKRLAIGTVAALSLSLMLGALTACKPADDSDEDDDEQTASRTDTQLIKNGDFEFYSEMDKELADKRAFINSPNSWSFTSGSPSSNTTSGIINTNKEEWDAYTNPVHRLVPEEDTPEAEKPSDAQAISEAMAHWSQASVYDRLQFLDYYEDALKDLSASSSEKKFFNDYKYSIDFEDVETLRKELGETVKTRHGSDEERGENTSMLMIHNQRTSDDVRGTGQYYTSSTTITLKPGTAAEVSVWVKTAELYHYAAETGADKKPMPVTRDSLHGGAYIGVTNTVGSSTLDQMQIKNIRSPYKGETGYDVNNGWGKYSVFVRGSTFAQSTFKIVLGLGMSTSSNRLEAVDGYALFDDLECTIMSNADYLEKTNTAGIGGGNSCTILSDKDEKIFDAKSGDTTAYALDLYAGFAKSTFADVETGLTTEKSGSKIYESKVADNRNDSSVETSRRSLAGLFTYEQLLDRSTAGDLNYNGYLANFFEKDFKDAFPFDGANKNDEQVLLLLSTNGAAYTSTLKNQAYTVDAKSYKLVSFFVKTNVRTGKKGASATLVDEGGNETKIESFDSTSVSATDIDNNKEDSPYNKKDIYSGWVQCFFFIENPTETAQTFTLKLHYGTTSIASSKRADYVDGYAAFASFETQDLTKAQYGYVSTDSRSVKVSLSDTAKDSSSFDTASRTSDIETGFATPASFNGIVSTNNRIDPENGTEENEVPAGVYTGLLNAKYAETYMGYKDDSANKNYAWSNALNTLAGGATDAQAWWNAIFADTAADGSFTGRVSNQPLVILNTNGEEATSYGYYLYNTATVAADAYQKISMRVKLSVGATAYIHLNDASEVKNGYGTAFTPTVPNVTYWYDDDGNICSKDPSDESFKKKTDILYYLETNGLYTKANDKSGTYYANLHNYDKDENGNLVTSDDKTIAYYLKKDADGKDVYYAYYDKKKDVYSQPVQNLPTTDDKGNAIVRYTVPENAAAHGSVIKVTGTQETAGKWIDVSFYVHAGNAQKTYRLELWAGSRNNEEKMPANSYFFFDSYSSTDASSDYQKLLDEKVQSLKTYYNKTNGLNPGDEGYLGTDDNLPEEYALYYTFTFYDAPWHLRYDETLDEEKEGNPYGNYKQSSNSEKLISLVYDNTQGKIEQNVYSYAYYLDYSAYDVTVERSTNSDSDTDDDHDHDDGDNESNIWLILSSVLLVVALVFAAGVVIGRRVWRRLVKSGRLQPRKKQKKQKKAPVEIVKETKAEEEKPADPNDPYNE